MLVPTRAVGPHKYSKLPIFCPHKDVNTHPHTHTHIQCFSVDAFVTNNTVEIVELVRLIHASM